MTELQKYYCQLGSSKVVFSGAKWFYGDSNIKAEAGVEPFNEDDLDESGDDIQEGLDNRRKLVRLIAVLKADGVAGVGDSTNRDRARYFHFLCDPSFVENAIRNLPRKNVDRGAGLGSYKIQKVMRPVRVTKS